MNELECPKFICLYGEPLLIVKHWTKFGPGVNGINIMISMRDVFSGGQEKFGSLSICSGRAIAGHFSRDVYLFSGYSDIPDSQRPCMCFFLACPKSTPHFAVYLVKKFAVVHFQRTQHNPHGLSEAKMCFAAMAFNSCPGA